MSGRGPGDAAGNSAATGLTDNNNLVSIAVPATTRNIRTKQHRFLMALVDGPKTTRQLEQAPVFDHCGHSTAAELRNRGVEIVTTMVSINGYGGLPTRVARYALTDVGRQHALRLLESP